jgi:hypothetical protein
MYTELRCVLHCVTLQQLGCSVVHVAGEQHFFSCYDVDERVRKLTSVGIVHCFDRLHHSACTYMHAALRLYCVHIAQVLTSSGHSSLHSKFSA